MPALFNGQNIYMLNSCIQQLFHLSVQNLLNEHIPLKKDTEHSSLKGVFQSTHNYLEKDIYEYFAKVLNQKTAPTRKGSVRF